jgi:hypothetical protein
MREWRYSSTTLDLSTRWRVGVSSMPEPLYPGTQWMGDSVRPTAGLDVVK